MEVIFFMRSESYKKYAIVRSDSAELFEQQLNAKLMELSRRKPDVTFSEVGDYMIARISYVASVSVPESESDLFYLKGVSLRCEDCPMFVPKTKTDGSADLRASKFGECEYAENGITIRHMRACDKCFELMREGRIKLCLSESE